MKNNDQFVDLYEIVASASCDGVRARMEKYRVKQTDHNFLPQRLTPEQEKEGYSHRMSTRVPVAELMKVSRAGFRDHADHVSRYIFCLKEQRQQALDLVRANMGETITKMRDQTLKLYDAWINRDVSVQEQPKKKKD